MSLKGYAIMAAISAHNRRSSSSNNNNNHNESNSIITTTATTTTQSAIITGKQDLATEMSSMPSMAFITSQASGNKSTTSKQQLDNVMTTNSTSFAAAPATRKTWPTTSTFPTAAVGEMTKHVPHISPHTSQVATTTPLNPYSRPKQTYVTSSTSMEEHHLHPHHRLEPQHTHHHHHRHYNKIPETGHIGGPNSSNEAEGDNEEEQPNESYEEDEDESDTVDGQDDMAARQRPINTFYGSGFGIFHQQRSNVAGGGGGGGIALITGNSGTGLGGSGYSNGINNNVNLLLGGAMLTLITTILCVVCYCCHRNIKKRTEAAYRQQRQWLENDPNMEIYSVEQCYETSGLFVGDSMDGLATIPALHHEPPPSYDAVVAMQEQQQLLMQQQQQQLLMQQLSNNSPPPGYRSSLDVSCILAARTASLTPAVLAMGSTDTNNSLATTSSLNVRGGAPSRTPPDNVSDCNGNRDILMPTTSTNGHMQQVGTFLRSSAAVANGKQQRHQRQLATANLANFNMKKVLQAQSCCSLQRAEVENMWNAAAAALAARSHHMASGGGGVDGRTAAVATSSPTLVMNHRKLSNVHHQHQQQMSETSKTNTPETFGSRYLKQQQNYYRRGCPLCGKFRYESNLSISMESDLDNLEMEGATTGNTLQHPACTERRDSENDKDNCGGSEEDIQNANEDLDEDDECSCVNSKLRKLRKSKHTTNGADVPSTNHNECNNNNNPNPQNESTSNGNSQENIELLPVADMNANAIGSSTMAREEELPTTALNVFAADNSSNNNNTDDILEEAPSCSHSNRNQLTPNPRTADSAASNSNSSSPAASSTKSITIDLNCINENGIISLDMSKIIDKTGLPTYDAALKLESSGYV
ncbi:spermiogenesis-related protein stanley-cup [Musca autumnalis]|uniref:spermiogenesis-related protein stanley-cup n=1 Tax=Musca autumnalis TaxID=221902 RepID=UPI003CF1F3DF